jgi:predicted DNA-binding protein with PD1-like motif
MKWRAEGESWWVRLDRGEEVGAALVRFAEEAGVVAGTISAIGALQETELGFLDLRSGEYRRRVYPNEVELLSFLGNFALVEGRPFLHAHAIISGSDYRALGGHFFRGVVAVTFEARVVAGGEALVRVHDPATGLKLLDL